MHAKLHDYSQASTVKGTCTFALDVLDLVCASLAWFLGACHQSRRVPEAADGESRNSRLGKTAV